MDTNETPYNSSPCSIGPLLEPREVAGMLKISLKTVHKLARERNLACVQVTARDRWCVHEDRDGYPISFQEPGRGNGERRKSVGGQFDLGGPRL